MIWPHPESEKYHLDLVLVYYVRHFQSVVFNRHTDNTDYNTCINTVQTKAQTFNHKIRDYFSIKL